MKHVIFTTQLDYLMRQANNHQLTMIRTYGKSHAARAADRELKRRERIAADRVGTVKREDT